MKELNSEQFELIYIGAQHQTEGDRQKVIEVLSSHCGFRLIEVEALLDRAPFTVSISSDQSELEQLATPLRSAGAHVQIVRPVQEKTAAALQALRGKPADHIAEFMGKYSSRLSEILQSLDSTEVQALVDELLLSRARRNQIFIIGNGGSAAAASHFANDLTKQRFEDESLLFRVISLTDNTATITATANDFGYQSVFLQQLKNLLQPEDLVIAISSSGNSVNIISALEYARKKGARTFGIVGFDGGKLRNVADSSIWIRCKNGQYGYMEDVTGIIGHMVSIHIFERDQAVHGL